MGIMLIIASAILSMLVYLATGSDAFSLERRDSVRIGFVTTMTTAAANIGDEMKNAAELALEHLGGEMAGLPVEIFYKDDQLQAAVGKQVTDELIQKENVDFVTGFIWSHILLASKKSVLDSGKFLISANAGPSQMAGKMCHENFFNVSWQADQIAMASAEFLNKKGIKKVYIMAPNYTAGRDMVTGFLRNFKGEVVGQDMTKWGALPQLDFSAEFAKVGASGANALWAFYPSGSNIAFSTQYEQSGLWEKNIPLHSIFMIDSMVLPRLKEAGLKRVVGSVFPQFWGSTLDYPANKKFVDSFKKKYGRTPSFYAAQSYDAINLISLAVSSVGGNLAEKDKMRIAMETADFESVRGSFRFGKNHFPIQNFYLMEVIEDTDGFWATRIADVLLKDHQDPYVTECTR